MTTGVGAEELGGRFAAKRQWLTPLLRLLNRYSFAFALVLAVVLLIVNLVRTPNFGWTDQLANFAPLALAAIASTPAIISGGGGFDLSVSPVMILTTGLYIIWLAPHGAGGGEAVPILLAIGAAIGAMNGLLIVRLRLAPMVVTLATFFIIIGVNLRLIKAPTFLKNTWITDLAGTVAGIPGALFLIVPPLVVWVALGLIPYRRALYAVGSNDAAAFSSGMDVGTIRVVAYALGGLFAAVGGLAVIAVTATASAGLSQTYALQGIAAVALGGTSLWGGRGGLFGSVLGAASIYLLGNLLITFNVNPSWLQVMYGLMLLLAVILVGVASRGREVS
jgi:ribose transport system permease protein